MTDSLPSLACGESIQPFAGMAANLIFAMLSLVALRRREGQGR